MTVQEAGKRAKDRARLKRGENKLSILHLERPPEWFHEGQLGAWVARTPEIGIVAGTQGGKTAFLPRWLRREIQRSAPLIRMMGRGDFLFVGPTLTLLESQAIPTFDTAFVEESSLGRLVKGTKPKFFFSEDGAKRTVGFKAPITVHFAYANDSSNLESLTALGGAWDEAGQKENKQASYEAFNRRLKVAQSTTFQMVWDWLCEKGLESEFAWWKSRYFDLEGPEATFGRRAWGTTPYEWNWFKTLIYDVAEGGKDPRWSFFNFPSWMNPRISKEACEKELDHEPLWRWQMMYEGKYTKPAGLVFDCFDDLNICDPFDIPKAWKRWHGTDFGGINTAAVLLAEDPTSGDLWQYSEYWPRQSLGFDEHTSNIRQRAADRAMPKEFEMTPSGAGGAHGEEGWREACRKHGLPTEEPPVNEVSIQYQCLYDQIKTKKLRIFRTCTRTIEMYQTFSYLLDDNQAPTDKYLNENRMHLLAGSRYIVTMLRPPKKDPPPLPPSHIPTTELATDSYQVFGF